ncbi:MAG: hypothetical protein AAF882_08430 [Pseudomonadota bacterium]
MDGVSTQTSFQVDWDFSNVKKGYDNVKWFTPVAPDENNERYYNRRGFQHSKDMLLNAEHRACDILRDQIIGGGLSCSVLCPIFHRGDGNELPSPDDPQLVLKWNAISADINLQRGSARFEIIAEKCWQKDGSVVRFHWIVDCRERGLMYSYIPNPARKGFNHKYHCRGFDLEVVSFKVNHREIFYFDKDTGELDPLARGLTPLANDCLDIDSKVDLVENTKVSPGDTNFCVGSCSGYLIAATNN